MRSLRRGLLQWTLGALALGSIVLVFVSYVVVLDEMNEVLDDNLQEVAASVARYHQNGQFVVLAPGMRARAAAAPDQSDLVTRVWRRDGQPVDGPDRTLGFAFDAEPGARRTTLDHVEWRTFTVVNDDFVVLAAQRSAARGEMAVEAASRLIPPLLALALMIGGLLVVALRRGLHPLHEATAQITQRNALTLEPIEGAEMPRELQPLVEAFNGLMHRLAAAFALQHRFVADAAHELRSPVAALRLQIDLVDQTPDGQARSEALRDLRHGIDRLQRLVEQLLQLSRAAPDRGDADVSRRAVALDPLAREVVAAHSSTASRRGIDLGADATSGAVVPADSHELEVMLNNLVRNALHYAPPGSRVDVRTAMEHGVPTLSVIDNGPGIPAHERERVFDRFFRGDGAHVREGDPAGSGLGLAIVRAMATRNGAIVSLHDGADGHGLEARIGFPSEGDGGGGGSRACPGC